MSIIHQRSNIIYLTGDGLGIRYGNVMQYLSAPPGRLDPVNTALWLTTSKQTRFMNYHPRPFGKNSAVVHNDTILSTNTIDSSEVLNILIDFSGLPLTIKRAGLEMVCCRIIDVVANMYSQIPNRCRLRLYGTWYENERLTPSAMELIGAIEQNKNALVVPWKTSSNRGSSLVSIEMAFALEIDRQNSSLTHDAPRTTFFALKNEQPERQTGPNTRFSEGSNLRSALVDTMLTADLIFLSTRASQSLVVVSSHDGIWPGIRMALLSGARIVHVHTKPKANELSADAINLVPNKTIGFH
jgi:hypothetical protein